MTNKPCPLCGREMTAIETYAGRGELYCGHCDLTIGGNEAKTPDELMALLEQRTCRNAVMCNVIDCEYNHKCRCTCGDLEIQDQECMTYRCRDIDYDEEEE